MICNIDIIRALDKIRIDNLYVHNAELPNASFTTEKLKGRKVYLVETLAVINALVDRGTMLLFGGHGGGKTTLAKYLGQMFCKLSKDEIEDCVLRGHPELTEEKILGHLDFAQLTGAKKLDKDDRINVIWNTFVDSKWKVIDEVNRLTPYAQNILLSLLAESTVKYHDQSRRIDPFTLFATMNPKDEGNWTMPLPFLDRFALALPITMPDYDSFSTIGTKDKSSRNEDLTSYLPSEFSLADVQKAIKNISYNTDARLFVNFIIDSFRLCKRISKESNDRINVDKSLCEGCHMNAPGKVCNKIRQPLSVRVKEDLVRYGKALAWFLGDEEVTVKHITILAPYMIWHRSILSKKFMNEVISHVKNEEKVSTFDYVVNMDLDATRSIIDMIASEFENVKSHLQKFEEVKMGILSKAEFDEFLNETKKSENNFLILNNEIIPILENNYAPVYGNIIDYNIRIKSAKDISSLKSIKEELAFSYNIPNRSYLSETIDAEIKKKKVKSYKFKILNDNIRKSKFIIDLISSKVPSFLEQDLQDLHPYTLQDLTQNDCSLEVTKNIRGYYFKYLGEETTEIFRELNKYADQ